MRGVLALPAKAYERTQAPWLQARRSGLGASDTATILGLNPWGSPYQVWADKVSSARPVDSAASEAAEWGSALEAVIARKVPQRHPELGRIAPTPGLLRHEEYPHILATLDRLLVPKGTPQARLQSVEPTAALEIKTVGEFMYRSHWIDGVPPVHIQVQVQQQLAVTGLDACYVAVLVGGQKMPRPYRIDRDDATIQAIMDYAAAWWRDHVVARVAPPLTLADKDIINSVYPGDKNLAPVMGDPETIAHLADYIAAKQRRDEALESMERAVFPVKAFMGDATAITDDLGNILATWTPTTRGRTFRIK